ncbi:MAG: tRNA-dihydrouridine synthase family protein [Planctomycetes bacterium]|nr:tRNA-dihydrouridine synthase family protein [Planctomycetota bacterium]
MLKIGSIELSVPFLQAPLSGYSDYAMRRLARDFGAPLTFLGVMLAKSAANVKVLKKDIFIPREDEHPIGAQILGREPEVMAAGAKCLEGAGYDLIDLNFACPAPKVLARGRGGYLINEPEKALEIYRSVRAAVKCPVTAKLRIGYDGSAESRENFWEIAECLSAEGIDAIAIHGRYVKQRFRDASDWAILTEAKERLGGTTIIGSGDLLDAESAAKALSDSGVDGVLIARGAIGNPWIFRELRSILEGGEKCGEPSITEQGEVILRHFELVSELYDDGKAVRYMRKFLVHYCRRHVERKRVQASMLEAENGEELSAAIKRWYCL